MDKIMPERCCTAERRSLLISGWTFIKLWAVGLVLLPVIRFINFRVPAQPRIFSVKKGLKKDGFILEPDFIIFSEETGPVAISRKCTHLGCRLNYHETEKILICPCHQSKFTRKGKRIAGPAERDLPVYDVETIVEENGNSYLVTVI